MLQAAHIEPPSSSIYTSSLRADHRPFAAVPPPPPVPASIVTEASIVGGIRTLGGGSVVAMAEHDAAMMMDPDAYDDDDQDGDGSVDGKTGRAKSRRELPAGAVATLKAWLLSPEHFTHPYPTPQDQMMLMQKTGIDKKQLKNWFTNARRRIWKPMLKKQIEQGKITTTGSSVGGVPGLIIPNLSGGGTTTTSLPHTVSSMDNPHSIQAMRAHYQQAVQHQQQHNPIQPVRLLIYRGVYIT
jgi:Homeobox KN domain